MKTPKTYTVVTGAGRGLGRAFAEVLAAQKRNLLLIALPNEHLDLLAEELHDRYGVEARFLEIDFAHSYAIDVLREWLPEFKIDMLVNNAGIGSASFFLNASLHDLDAIIQVNIRTLTLLTRLLIPELKQHPDSYILNVSSLSCYSPVAYKTVYPASKSFVYSFSRSLCEELKGTNVHVSVVLPGPIKTNMEVSRRIEQHGWWVRESLLTPLELATMAVQQTFRGRKVIIPGKINKINWLMTKLVPRGIQIPLLSKVIKEEILKVAAMASATPLPAPGIYA